MSGKTLYELLNEDLGIGEVEKTASVSSSLLDDEIDKLAAEMGIDLGNTKVAQEADQKEEEEEEDSEEKEPATKEQANGKPESDKKEDGVKKEANMSLETLFNELYPQDADLSKTAAELEKEAHDEAIGARMYEYFTERFNNRITKIAADMAESLKTSGGEKSISEKVDFPAQLDNDSSKKDMNAIGTDSKENGVEAANKAESGAAASGSFSGDKLAMAFRKHLLKASLE